jgi:hypothetical protein
MQPNRYRAYVKHMCMGQDFNILGQTKLDPDSKRQCTQSVPVKYPSCSGQIPLKFMVLLPNLGPGTWGGLSQTMPSLKGSQGLEILHI